MRGRFGSTLTERLCDVADQAIPIVRRLDQDLTAVLGGPGSDQVGALGDALRTLLPLPPNQETSHDHPHSNPTPALTGREIGQAQRAIGALLDRKLEAMGLPFAHWTVLFTSTPTGPLPEGDPSPARSTGSRCPRRGRATLDRMIDSGMPATTAIGSPDPRRGRVPPDPGRRLPAHRRTGRRPAARGPGGDPADARRGDPPGQRQLAEISWPSRRHPPAPRRPHAGSAGRRYRWGHDQKPGSGGSSPGRAGSSTTRWCRSRATWGSAVSP